MSLDFSGSSPHTWGIPLTQQPEGLTARFIPTYVGHTWDSSISISSIPVHPHIRGAYCSGPFLGGTPAGSSPHTWGILPQAWKMPISHRFIPTYVGHTSCIFVTHSGTPVHPHIRGAYGSDNGQHSKHAGSSPHTWGILSSSSTSSACWGFIPTYVGHTASSSILTQTGSVHPHIRGAYQRGQALPPCLHGSSPHTWGKRSHRVKSFHPLRFIPTYVGHTGKKSWETYQLNGSSPHTWGIHRYER